MKIFGIDLEKCSATEMFEKLEHEVEFQKTVAKAHDYFERQSLDNVKYTRVYFLPFLSLIFSISLFFSFPDSTRK